MAGCVNKAIIIGNLGADPEVRQIAGGSVCNLRVATTDTWRDKQSGERREKVEWHSIVIFNEQLIKIAQQYLKKGAKVYIEGQLQTRKWQDNAGNDRYTTEVVLQNYNGQLTMLDAPKLAQPTEQNLRRAPQRAQISGTPPRNVAAKQLQAAPSFESEGSGWDFDDEIPFK